MMPIRPPIGIREPGKGGNVGIQFAVPGSIPAHVKGNNFCSGGRIRDIGLDPAVAGSGSGFNPESRAERIVIVLLDSN